MDLDLVSRSPFVPVNNVTRFEEQCTIFPAGRREKVKKKRGKDTRRLKTLIITETEYAKKRYTRTFRGLIGSIYRVSVLKRHESY